MQACKEFLFVRTGSLESGTVETESADSNLVSRSVFQREKPTAETADLFCSPATAVSFPVAA